MIRAFCFLILSTSEPVNCVLPVEKEVNNSKVHAIILENDESKKDSDKRA